MKYSHFENIGFGSDIEEMFKQTIARSRRYIGKTYNDFDFQIYNDNNIFLVYILKDNEVYSLNPHYNGKSRNKLLLEEFQINEAGDCRVYGWIDPSEDLKQGIAPIYFNYYDFFVNPDFKTPCLENVQITAFAHDFEIFKSKESFDAEKKIKLSEPNELGVEEIHFSSEYFIPVGVFEEERIPIAQFAATVKEIELIENNLTKRRFYHIFAQGMIEVDIVYPFEKELNIETGDIIDGIFWLSGSIL